MSELLSDLAKAKATFQQNTIAQLLKERPLYICSHCGEGEETDSIDWTCGNLCESEDL